MKFIGVLFAIAGWLISVVALTLTQSTSARLAITLFGMALAVVGILGVINKAYLKHALWKQ